MDNLKFGLKLGHYYDTIGIWAELKKLKGVICVLHLLLILFFVLKSYVLHNKYLIFSQTVQTDSDTRAVEFEQRQSTLDQSKLLICMKCALHCLNDDVTTPSKFYILNLFDILWLSQHLLWTKIESKYTVNNIFVKRWRRWLYSTVKTIAIHVFLKINFAFCSFACCSRSMLKPIILKGTSSKTR